MGRVCGKILIAVGSICLFLTIIEKAHMLPDCQTAPNTSENLLVLCPNCHTAFDKNYLFRPEQMKSLNRSLRRLIKSLKIVVFQLLHRSIQKSGLTESFF